MHKLICWICGRAKIFEGACWKCGSDVWDLAVNSHETLARAAEVEFLDVSCFLGDLCGGLPKGETVMIVGGWGAGKTSLTIDTLRAFVGRFDVVWLTGEMNASLLKSYFLRLEVPFESVIYKTDMDSACAVVGDLNAVFVVDSIQQFSGEVLRQRSLLTLAISRELKSKQIAGRSDLPYDVGAVVRLLKKKGIAKIKKCRWSSDGKTASLPFRRADR